MRILVINLARSTGRKRSMQQRLAALGLAHEFLEATAGCALTASDTALADDGRRRRRFRRPLSDNEIACFISHRRAMARLVASGDPMMAILEDDIVLSADLPRALAAIEAQDGLFDVVDLGWAGKRSQFFVPCRPLTTDLWLGRTGYLATGAVGYVISRSAAGRFLFQTKRFVDELDRELHRYWVNGLDIYSLSRPVVFHDNAVSSTIDETREKVADYAEADRLYWIIRRNVFRLSTSFWKRVLFPAYVRKGRRLVQKRG